MSILNQQSLIEMPDFHIKLALKATLIICFIIIASMAICDLFFLESLSESGIKEIENIGMGSTLIVSELAKSSINNRNSKSLHQALQNTLKTVIEEEYGLLQISVFLFPSGRYYSSTAKEFNNRTVHPSLYNKIKSNRSKGVSVSRLTYKINNNNIPVLQFLQNITDKNQKRIAVTQILFDYSYLIDATRKQILLIGGMILLVSIVPIWILLVPISQAHKNVIEGMSQIREGNFNFRLVGNFADELDLLYQVFNRMAETLKIGFKEVKEPEMPQVNQPITPDRVLDSSLRKVDITCLCARIPDIQEQIGKEKLSDVFEFIDDYLFTFQKIIEEHGGQQIRILGNKVYCLFEGVNAIDNSIRTALKGVQIWREINHERKILNQKQLDFGIGLHTAPSIVGVFRKTMGDYTVVGEIGNVAAILCSCAKTNTILISSSMIDQAGASFEHQPLVDVTIPKLLNKIEASVLQNPPRDAQSVQTVKAQVLRNAHKGVESTIPNMLEETYQVSPLETVKSDDKFEEFINELPVLDGFENQNSDGEEQKSENDKDSMWDQFDVSPVDDKLK
ncbi:MAG: hypothetical protein GY786_15640 [Proteobacteria bacterium]|nr:hypothetical protein [Pseudomonadota bacterium]